MQNKKLERLNVSGLAVTSQPDSRTRRGKKDGIFIFNIIKGTFKPQDGKSLAGWPTI